MFHKKRKLPSLQRRMILISLTAAIVLLLLCSMIIFSLISNVLRGYVKNDLEFVLQQTLTNMDDKTLLVEDTYNRLVSNSDLIEILETNNGLETSEHIATQILQSQAGLYLERNTSNLTKPFLDMVYIFDRSGQYIFCSYESHTDNIQETWDLEYINLYQHFKKADLERSVQRARNHINVICPIRNSDGLIVGTVIFGIDENAFLEMAAPFNTYPNSFWLICDERNNRILASRGNPLDNEDIQAITPHAGSNSFSYHSGYTNYLVSSRYFRMGIGAIVAIPENYFNSLLIGSVRFYFITMAAVIILLGIFLMLMFAKSLHPLQEMAATMQQVSQGQLETRLPEYPLWEYHSISAACNSMLDHIDHLINDVYEKKLIIMNSEMKFLQSQMDPHFMYNVLNTIAITAKMDGNEEIYQMTSNFMGLTQARLSLGGNPFVSLEQELQYIKFYLGIQQSRFEGKILASIDVPQNLYQAKVPKLSLEMLVENAIKHGIEPKYGVGHITLTAKQVGNGLQIVIEDDGVGFPGSDGIISLPLPEESPKAGHNRIAINNTYQLIRHYYGDPYGMQIESYEGVGTHIEIQLPFERWEDRANYV